MLDLKNVTLCTVACVRVDEAIFALKQSMRDTTYNKVILITHEKTTLDNTGIEVIQIEKLDYKGYNHFILYRLKDYVTTDFVLVVQDDGYVLRPQKWQDDFFMYDYIGAPWIGHSYYTKQGKNIRVGNGGFSFRSKKLLELPTKLNLPFIQNEDGTYAEDYMLCVVHHALLEQNDIKYAPVKVASVFSREFWWFDSQKETFGFHKNKKKINSLPVYTARTIKNMFGIRFFMYLKRNLKK